MSGHDRYEMLAATALDFPLSDAEAGELRTHLIGCASCARFAARIRADSDLALARLRVETPAHVRTAVAAAAVRGLPIRRSRFVLQTAGALAVVLAVAVALATFGPLASGVGAPSSSPSPSPLATPRQIGSPMPPPYLDGTFTSPLYHYVVHYPGTWRITPATRLWTRTINSANDIPYWGDAALDTLQGPDVRLVVWAQPIPQAQGLTQGQAVDLWIRNLKIGNGLCVADSQLPPSFAVAQGQAQGYALINGCGPAPDRIKDSVIYEVALVLNGVGWDFTFDGRVDAPYVFDVLATVSLSSAGLSATSGPAPTATTGG